MDQDQIKPFQDLNEIIKEENKLQIDRQMIELQKTIIFYSNQILHELKELKELKASKEVQLQKYQAKETSFTQKLYDMDAPIRRYLQTIKVPKGYGGSSSS